MDGAKVRELRERQDNQPRKTPAVSAHWERHGVRAPLVLTHQNTPIPLAVGVRGPPGDSRASSGSVDAID
jgi:hypothetical protein